MKCALTTLTPLLFILANCATAGTSVSEDRDETGPYVTVYRDDAVAFQVRADRSRAHGDGSYLVWLRWLWADPIERDGRTEVARLMVAQLDCPKLAIQELATMRKDHKGEIFDAEELDPDVAPWTTADPTSGAGTTIRRLCEFLPELLSTR